MNATRHRLALPAGHRLHWYTLESLLGQGGFGITYLAHDTNLDQPVAIKEFLPTELASRDSDSQVHPLTDGHTDTFSWGLSRFITEAQTLARFRHPNIVRVLSVFEANNTAYMVMEYELGESLEDAFRLGRIRDEAAMRALLLPVLDGLEQVHAAGFIHRDIKPDNIYLRADGTPVLLDFGSARQAVGVAARTLTALVTPGYAPFEQYDNSRDADARQGPWTDVYALGATVYRGITGRGPPDAMARVNAAMAGGDVYRPLTGRTGVGYGAVFLAAVDRALGLRPEDRPASIEAWRCCLDGKPEPPVERAPPTAQTGDVIDRDAPTEIAASGASRAPPPVAATRARARPAGAVAVLFLAALAGAAGWWLRGGDAQPNPVSATAPATSREAQLGKTAPDGVKVQGDAAAETGAQPIPAPPTPLDAKAVAVAPADDQASQEQMPLPAPTAPAPPMPVADTAVSEVKVLEADAQAAREQAPSPPQPVAKPPVRQSVAILPVYPQSLTWDSGGAAPDEVVDAMRAAVAARSDVDVRTDQAWGATTDAVPSASTLWGESDPDEPPDADIVFAIGEKLGVDLVVLWSLDPLDTTADWPVYIDVYMTESRRRYRLEGGSASAAVTLNRLLDRALGR